MFFFFSSRRRHTRFDCDWSSDVCSSDLNKIDRPGARPDWVVNATFDMMDKLGASEHQLDFPVVYASALLGTATLDLSKPGTDMRPLFRTIIDRVPAPKGDPDGPLQLQISNIDYSS